MQVSIRLDQYNILTKSQLGTIRSGADEVLVQNALNHFNQHKWTSVRPVRAVGPVRNIGLALSIELVRSIGIELSNVSRIVHRLP